MKTLFGHGVLKALPAWLSLAIASGNVRSQDLGETEAEVQPADVANRFVLDEANFNQWVFGNVSPKNLSTEERFKALLAVTVADVERSCPLSESRKRKLLLAGRGDIKRFTDRVADARAMFDRLKNDQNNINAIFQETQPLAALLANGLFGEGSLYAKTLATTLEPEQAARYRESVREKQRFRYKAKVALALARLDDAVGFTAEQNRRFHALILEETAPLEKPAGAMESNLVLLKIARIPESKIRPIFDDAQWQALGRQLQKARALEPMLRDNGLLDPTEPAKADKHD